MPDLRTSDKRRVSLWASEMGGGHQLRGLVGGVAEHHALVACSAGVDAHGDVAGLLVDGRDHGAGIGVESIDSIVIANGADDATDQRLEVDIGAGGDFSGNDDEAGRGEGFAGHAAVGVLLKAGVKDSVGNLVGDFVGMAFGDGFRGKEKAFGCGQEISSRGMRIATRDRAAESGEIARSMVPGAEGQGKGFQRRGNQRGSTVKCGGWNGPGTAAGAGGHPGIQAPQA